MTVLSHFGISVFHPVPVPSTTAGMISTSLSPQTFLYFRSQLRLHSAITRGSVRGVFDSATPCQKPAAGMKKSTTCRVPVSIQYKARVCSARAWARRIMSSVAASVAMGVRWRALLWRALWVVVDIGDDMCWGEMRVSVFLEW